MCVLCSVKYGLIFHAMSVGKIQLTLLDQYKFKWILPCIEVVLFKRFRSHYIDRGDKIWGFSFVHCGEVYNTLPLSEDLLRGYTVVGGTERLRKRNGNGPGE